MGEFATYYVDFLWNFWNNFKGYFVSIFSAIGKIFTDDLPGYFKSLSKSVVTFDVFGWITFIIVVLINVTLVFFISYMFFQLIRRYIIFRAKEVDKDILMEEIAKLKEQAERLVKEKNEIFALKMGVGYFENSADANKDTYNNEPKKEEKAIVVAGSRFTKLIDIDKRYERMPHNIYMTETDMLELGEVVKRFVNFAASQLKLYYEEEVVRIFFAGMATSKVLILEGISGTGKTSLPYAMGKFFNNSASLISVQPSWRDRSELLGYLNEFTKKFNESDFLSNLYEATLREDPNFIVLDEMNLARIEYYFAEFLSVMEMPDKAEWKIEVVPSADEADPKNLVYGKLLVPQNCWFIGTANKDDSTFTITDKVYDRAVTIELNNRAEYFDAKMTDSLNCTFNYLDSLYKNALSTYKISIENMDRLLELDRFIQDKFKVAFGNRIMKQFKLFVPVYVASGGIEINGLDFMISSKILRKFNSLNLPFLTKEMNELLVFFDKKFGKNTMKYSISYIKDLQKNV